MAKKGPRSPILDALRLACRDERLAVEFMERHRWGDMPACPKDGCGCMDVYQMSGADGGRNKDYRWRCRGCKKMFTVRTGTVMEETRLPMRAWCFAFWRACASKKGVAALQIHRETEISYKSALYLMHRIRTAMGTDDGTKLSGTVEADETYVGGKPRYRGPHNKHKSGRGTDKTPVVVVVQRGGAARLRAMQRLTTKNLAQAIEENVDLRSRFMTDDLNAYTTIGRKFAGGHFTTKHSYGRYVDFDDPSIHSNTAESVFSLIKRGVYGTFHSVSKKHLPKYLNEFEFRWATRFQSDGERVSAAVKAADGKRLTYQGHVGA